MDYKIKSKLIYKNIKNRLSNKGNKINHIAFSPQIEFILLISYPKSGSTWLRMILATYLNKSNIDIIDLPYYSPSVDHIHKGDIEQNELRLDKKVFIKSHHPFHNDRVKTIYLSRDPRDVSVSYFHYLKNIGSLPQNISFTKYLKEFFTSKYAPYYGWKKHINTFEGISKDKVLKIKYEDLLLDTETAVRKVLSFSNVPIEPKLIKYSIEANNFKLLQQNAESAQVINTFSKQQPKQFFRKGKSGDWKNHFTTIDEKIMESYCEELYKKYCCFS